MFNNSFYITLPSNASMDVYPDNTLASYTTKLAQRISLIEDDWEVGLTEIQYPTLFSNVNASNVWLRVGYYNKDDTSFTLEDGVYDTMENLAQALNSSSGGGCIFEYRKNVNRIITNVDILTVNKVKYVIISPSLAAILGYTLPSEMENFLSYALYNDFQPNKADSGYLQEQIKMHLRLETNIALMAKYPINLEFEKPAHMYLYSDIVAPNFLGDKLAPLLRIVRIENNPSINIEKTFSEPYYIPVLKRNFETVEIHIKDDTGNAIPFLSGKLNVRLHFRRNKNNASLS